MRILVAILAAALPLSSSAAGPEAKTATPLKAPPLKPCDKTKVHHAGPAKPIGPSKLGELPPGNLELAVQREVDGCGEPTIVRYNFRGN